MRPRISLLLLGLALLALAGVLALTPPKGELRSGGSAVYRVGPVPEMSLVVAARDTEYCGYHTACGPGKRTDTILYVHVRGGEAEILAIPRDLLVSYQGISGKVNAIYGRAGADGLRRAVEELLGVPVEHYLILTFDSVMKLVDAVDGIEVDLPEPMRYTDRAAGLFIDFPAGRVKMDGKDAVKYMRFRHDASGDYTRLDRIKGVLSQVAQKAQSPRYWPRLPGVAQEIWSQIETDLNLQEALAFLPYARGLTLRAASLPTYEEGNYLLSDPARRSSFVQSFLGLVKSHQRPGDAGLAGNLGDAGAQENSASADRVPEGRVLLVDQGGGSEGKRWREGFTRMALPEPELREEKLGLEPGVYVLSSALASSRGNQELEVGRYYSDLLHLPLISRFRPVVEGYDAVVVVGSPQQSNVQR
ncbi:MAG TPA: LCP family protein [Meiothermus sp.]|nr:LCP family protein [Meiothermus sp.]